ncbi:DUF1129 family protein [Ornithinibacillus sp. 4-3]|uniref:DUF1129 family protein n=1 Tax=Ornithinibacillus sp. 4-3 TaxID=3231488 RepID=A0AB39HM69_9BACI
MNAKQLIEENNKKRKLLTKENEKYYDDLLVYIRLHFTLSEQQTEEVLMEMLDHLIDGQKEGKTAKDIFGDDPLSYTDEIIEQLPKEDKRNIFQFVGGVIVNIISWVLIIRGIILLVFSQFTEVNNEINLLGVSVVSLAIGIFVIGNIWYMLKVTKKSLFNEKISLKTNMLKVGLVAAVSMAIVLAVARFTPEIGPSFSFDWWLSLLLGAILWLLHFIVKKKSRNA